MPPVLEEQVFCPGLPIQRFVVAPDPAKHWFIAPLVDPLQALLGEAGAVMQTLPCVAVHVFAGRPDASPLHWFGADGPAQMLAPP